MIVLLSIELNRLELCYLDIQNQQIGRLYDLAMKSTLVMDLRVVYVLYASLENATMLIVFNNKIVLL